MKFKKIGFCFALLLPIVVLGGIVLLHYFHLNSGIQVTLPIKAYDLRSLLSGHYLRYRLVFSDPHKVCRQNTPKKLVYLCLHKGEPDWHAKLSATTKRCDHYTKGECRYGFFATGLEKFYIPEAEASLLEQAVLRKRGSVVLKVGSNGGAVVKTLLIDHKPWRDYVTAHKKSR